MLFIFLLCFLGNYKHIKTNMDTQSKLHPRPPYRCLEIQRLFHLVWALTAAGLFITALVIDPLGTITRFSYWNLIFHVFLFLYLALGVDIRRAVQYPLTALAWSVLWLFAMFIGLVLLIIVVLADEQTSATLNGTEGIGNVAHTAAGAWTWEVAIHLLPFLALFCVVGLPLVQVRAFITSLAATTVLLIYNLFLLALATNAFTVYNIRNNGNGGSSVVYAAGGGACALAFLFAALLTEISVSDILFVAGVVARDERL